jgi:moderate conductance mechanosensitive channel
MRRFVFALILLLIACGPSFAQSPLPTLGKQKASPKIELPDPLTQQAVRDLLSELDDKQVRALLVKRLDSEIAERAKRIAKQDQRDLRAALRHSMSALGVFFADVIQKVPVIPSAIGESIARFQKLRGNVSFTHFWASLSACLIFGVLAAFGIARIAGDARERILRARPETSHEKIKWLGARFLLQISGVAVFWFVAEAFNLWLNANAMADGDTVSRAVSAIALTWLTVLVARFLLSPTAPELRLCSIDDRTAAGLTVRIGWIAALYSFGVGFVRWMTSVGTPLTVCWLGFWVNLAIHVAVGVTIWQYRHSITAMLAHSGTGDVTRPNRFSVLWPRIAIALLFVNWLVIELVAATSVVPPGLLAAVTVTLLTLVAVPFIDQALRVLMGSLVPTDPEASGAITAADEQTRIGLVRIVRVIIAVLVVLLVLRLWNVNLVGLAEKTVGTRTAGALFNSALILVLAYAMWEFIGIITYRQIAFEQASMGIDPNAPSPNEGEIGGEGARLGTLLPLVQIAVQTAIVTLAGLAVLGELGVNVLPLLAGAGIVGLAVGFGAQTLVKDIISGIFFLIDDAFRKGEYIDVGDVKGTVERISIRSMQLRHHNGPLNTVPFGDIRHVTNFSRDWVMMKLPLRLTYDTDAEKVRKMIKKLGETLLEDPAIGHQFLQPLKSQGVIQMEESAMIMRVKFMTRPGDQWTIRRIVLAKIRDLFEENGIKFANREVTVRIADDDGHEAQRDRTAAAAGAARAIQSEVAKT